MLKRLPSEYMREMYYTTQPLEKTNLKLLAGDDGSLQRRDPAAVRVRLAALGLRPAEFDHHLPFLSEQAKRNILGLNAARVFNLEVKRTRPRARDVLAARAGVA